MSTSDSSKDGASKSSGDDVCEVNNMLQNMSTVDIDGKENIVLSVCANCGKEGNNLKACTACKLVKYCNRECQIAHRPQHKKECKKRVAELHDEKLFKQPPSEYGDCPICFLLMPILDTGWRYMTCCGKTICSGCSHAPLYDNQGNKLDIVKQNECPFCRVLAPKSIKEVAERFKKRVEANDAYAIYGLGNNYRDGKYGFPQDYVKALELFHRAAKLGYSAAYLNIGYAYNTGKGVEFDNKKANHYYELAAMGGNEIARHNLGVIEEEDEGNYDRALKHYMVAVGSGSYKSLKKIKKLYSDGHATKEEYTKALQLYQEYLGEIKSRQRDEAAVDFDECRYY